MECNDKRGGCAALAPKNGCHALNNTDFGGKPCPFYMDKKTKERVMRECGERLAGMTRRGKR